MSRFETFCPECGETARILVSPAPMFHTCPACALRTPVDELDYRTDKTLLRGVDIRFSLTAEFIGSAFSESDGDGTTLTLPGVPLGPGDILLTTYIQRFTLGTITSVLGTWNGIELDAVPFSSTVITDEATISGLGIVYINAFKPVSPGTGAIVITEDADIPDKRLLAAFRVHGASTFNADGTRDDVTEAPMTIGPNQTIISDSCALVAGLLSLNVSGLWRSASRIARVTSPSLTIDLALEHMPISTTVYDGFGVDNAGGILFRLSR